MPSPIEPVLLEVQSSIVDPPSITRKTTALDARKSRVARCAALGRRHVEPARLEGLRDSTEEVEAPDGLQRACAESTRAAPSEGHF